MKNQIRKIGFTLCIVLQTLLLISCGAGSNSSNEMSSNEPSNTTKSVTTEINESPTVTMLTPLNNSVIKFVQPVIKIEFSQAVTGVNNSTVYLNIIGTTYTVPTTEMTAEPNNVYSFKPTEPLEAGNLYAVNIGQGIQSVSTGAEVSPTFFTFKVEN